MKEARRGLRAQCTPAAGGVLGASRGAPCRLPCSRTPSSVLCIWAHSGPCPLSAPWAGGGLGSTSGTPCRCSCSG
eukprot:11191673-Lingulodinium_polyedra.AAC.1